MTKEPVEETTEELSGVVTDGISKAIKDAVAPAVEKAIAEVTEETTLRSAKKLPPGTTIGRGTGRARKVPWTMAHVREIYEDVTFTPEETMPVTFNGVSIHLVSDVEITVPAVFQGLYNEYRKSVRRHGSGNVNTPYGPVSVVPGAGPLPV